MEQSLAEIAEGLGAKVIYRASGDWGFGEFLDAVQARYSELLKKAAKAANSWNDDAAQDVVKAAQGMFRDASLIQLREKWPVNPAVHYNEWGNFVRQDFEPVVEACRTFLAIFTCETCESQLHLSGPTPTKHESLRCSCGLKQFSLVERQ